MSIPSPCRRGLLALALMLTLSGSALAGTAQLELVSATGTGCNANPVAKCFNSITLTTTGTTDATVAPNDPGASSAIYVPAMWTGGDAYTELVACPAAGATGLSATTGTLLGSLDTVFSGAIWATPLADLTVALSAGGDGITVVVSPTCTLVWKAVSSSVSGIAPASDTPSCTAGSYQVAANVCALCRAGSYAGAAAAASCTTIAAGKELSIVGASVDGSSCGAGTFAESDGTSDCVPCPVGTFASGTAATTCSACPGAAYAYVPGSVACVRCVAGRAATCVDDASCSALGTASSGYATATSALVASTCSAKPAMFTTCAGVGATLSFYVKATCEVVITPLNDGATTANGLTCSTPDNGDYTVTGFYTSADTIMSLLSGSAGSIVKVAKVNNSTATITISEASTDPNAQPAAACSGALAVTGGAVVAAASATCPEGTHASGADGTLSCEPCAAGKYCPDSATATDCGAGTANPNLGTSTACTNCLAGQSSDAGATTCSSCAANTYNAIPGGACISCPGAAVGVSTCNSNCTDVKQFRNPVTGECEFCPGGYGVNSTTGVPTCTLCPAGTQSPTDSASCTLCGAGTYAAQPGTETCANCTSGTSANGIGATSCTECPPGQTTVVGSEVCTNCVAGYYRANSGSASNAACIKCPSGYKTDAATGATACTKCSAGSYAVWTDSVTRFPTAPATCQPCAAGTSNAKTGQKVCLTCPGGQYTTYNNATAGADANTNHGALTCGACSIGTWRPAFSPSTLACAACAVGSETTVPKGATVCTVCAAGTYSNTAGGAAFCSDCEANKSSDEGATSCSNCPAGTDTDGATGSECAPCAPGTVNPTGGASCSECGIGTYQDVEGKTTCRKCAVGFYSSSTGADSCLSCPAGRYSNVQGSTSCKTCPAGTSSVGAAGSCTLCAAGYYSAAGSSQCTACPIGTFATKKGAASCTKCPPGSFCDTTALPAAKKCPAGQYTSSSGQKACARCPANTYAAAAGASACKKCAAGTSTNKLTGATGCAAFRRRALLAGAVSA